jgi:hypothetical protein
MTRFPRFFDFCAGACSSARRAPAALPTRPAGIRRTLPAPPGGSLPPHPNGSTGSAAESKRFRERALACRPHRTACSLRARIPRRRNGSPSRAGPNPADNYPRKPRAGPFSRNSTGSAAVLAVGRTRWSLSEPRAALSRVTISHGNRPAQRPRSRWRVPARSRRLARNPDHIRPIHPRSLHRARTTISADPTRSSSGSLPPTSTVRAGFTLFIGRICRVTRFDGGGCQATYREPLRRWGPTAGVSRNSTIFLALNRSRFCAGPLHTARPATEPSGGRAITQGRPPLLRQAAGAVAGDSCRTPSRSPSGSLPIEITRDSTPRRAGRTG